jgi:hypothetical protein
MNAKNASVLPWPWIAGLAAYYLLVLSFLSYQNWITGSELWQMVVNSFLLSIPLLIFCVSVGLLVACGRQHARGALRGHLAAWLFRGPRITAILIILFVGLFSLDVFEMEGSIWMKLGAFVIHSLPSIVMAILLALAWRWEWVGFAAFLLAGLFFLRAMFFDPLQGIGMFAIFTGPMIAIALLFGANWLWRKELHPLPKA